MITVDDATEVLNRFSLNRITSVKLKDSFGRVLAEDIVSGIDVPSFDRSDMDGYAIRDQDLDGRRFKLVDGVAYPTFKGSGLITSIGYADGIVAIGEAEMLREGEVDVWVL